MDTRTLEIVAWAKKNPAPGCKSAGYRKIMREFGVTRSYARYCAALARGESREAPACREQKQDISVVEEQISQILCEYIHENPPEHAPPISEFLEKLIDLQDDILKREHTQSHVKISIKTDRPILLVVRADWHFGSVHTNHRRFLEDNELIKERPYVKTIEGGDLIDGGILSRMVELVQEQLAPVKLQRQVLWAVLKEISKNVLVLVKGQHDSWAEQIACFDPIEWASHDTKIPFIGWGGKVTLTVGEQQWEMVIRHNFPFNSSYNATHTNKQLMRMGEHGVTDISIVCDKHVPAYEEFLMHGQMRIAMRPGSYKPRDFFSQKHGFSSALPLMPGVILWNDQRKFIGSSDFRDLIPLIDAIYGKRSS